MNRSRHFIKFSAITLFICCLATPSAAQDDDDVIDANNPLAVTETLSLENHYAPSLSDGIEGSTNRFALRYMQPVSGFLIRAELPTRRVPAGSFEDVSGLGDIDLFVPYLIDTGDPTQSLGIGPVLSAPSATEDPLGTGKWQAGVGGAYFNSNSAVVQWGGITSWRTDIGGDEARAGTSLLEFQPFLFLQLGGGLYARSAPTWIIDLDSDTHHVPLSLGLGKVISAGSVVYNVFLEPQFSILDDGPGQGEFQLYMGLNLQFK